MKTHDATHGSKRPEWQQRVIAAVRRTWSDLHRLVLGEHRQHPAPVLIPIRIAQSQTLRPSKRRTWRD